MCESGLCVDEKIVENPPPTKLANQIFIICCVFLPHQPLSTNHRLLWWISRALGPGPLIRKQMGKEVSLLSLCCLSVVSLQSAACLLSVCCLSTISLHQVWWRIMSCASAASLSIVSVSLECLSLLSLSALGVVEQPWDHHHPLHSLLSLISLHCISLHQVFE